MDNLKDKFLVEKRTFIIAEAGVNHNGKLPLAKRLVDKAKEAGVDAVKFQTFKAEDLVTKETGLVSYQRRNTGKNQTQYEMLKELELKEKDFLELSKYCRQKNITFLSTPHTENSVDFLEPIVLFYKIGSGDLNNLSFLKKIASKNKPIILSTGMATIDEVRKAVKAIKQQNKKTIILMHCTTSYPCVADDINLRAVVTLKEKFGLPVGYSDHTLDIIAPVIAVSLGVSVIEKHFTLDKELSGPDHKASLNPDELKKLVQVIRYTEKALGSQIKKPSSKEKKIKQLVRKSIVVKKTIFKDSVVTRDNITFKRSRNGIGVEFLDKVIGRKVRSKLNKDSPIKFENLK